MLKRKILPVLIASSLFAVPSVSNAGLWESTKEKVNGAIPWKQKHLDDLSFEEVYPKGFINTTGFQVTVLGVASVMAITVSIPTGGTGAPSALAGVGALATWIGGGGQGAYMAGLATVGGWFGGNAILGGMILNGVSAALLGGAASTAGIAAKAGVAAYIAASALDGIFIFDNPETNQVEYRVRVKQPEGIGSKNTRELIASISEVDGRIAETLSELSNEEIELVETKLKIDVRKQEELENNIRILKKEHALLLDKKESYIAEGLNSLKEHLNRDDNQEDLLVLSVLAWNELEFDLFSKAVNKIDSSQLKKTSFLDYLLALDALSKGNEDESIDLLAKSMNEAPYALEPKLLYLNILGNSDFKKNKVLINSVVRTWEDEFDSDEYASNYSTVSLYYRLGTMFFINEDYEMAANYYEQAYKNMRITEKYLSSENTLKRTILIGQANAMFMNGQVEEANEIYQAQLENIDDIEEQNQFKQQYVGEQK